MSKKLKQYKLQGIRFVHDSRGRFVRDGEIAWLEDERARKFIAALKRDGRADALVPIATEEKAPKTVTVKEPSEDSTAAGAADEEKPFSVGETSPLLGLHFSVRKKAASLIAGEEIKTTPEADELLKASPADVIRKALKAIETVEA